MQQIDRTYARFRKRKLSYFSGCDYFRMASHPKVIAAVQAGVRNFGLNVSASRLTTGNHVLYRQLERGLERFFKAEAALVVGTGYLSNLAVAQALAGNFSHVLIDEKAHPSLVDAAEFFQCPILKFKYRDVESAADAAKRCGRGARLILLTDGMFSHDGSAAPLKDYLAAIPREGLLLVDDSHGAGVLGLRGRGTPEHCGVDRSRLIQTITLSKAFGVYGGAILGGKQIRQAILDRSRLYIGHTPPPLPLIYAALQSVELLAADLSFRRRLVTNTQQLKSALKAKPSDFSWGDSLDTPGPILRVEPRSPQAGRKLRARLESAKIYPPFLRYPGGPDSGYFRFVISSEHSERQLTTLQEVLSKVMRQ